MSPRSLFVALFLCVALRVPAVWAAPTVSVTDSEITVTATPGGKVSLMLHAKSSPSLRIYGLTDSDGDGVYRVARTSTAALTAIAADVSTGEGAWASSGVTATEFPMPAGTILRGPGGAFTWVVFPQANAGPIHLLWVRPGVGAWVAELPDEIIENTFLYDVGNFMPSIEKTPVPHPASFQPGDRLMALRGFDPMIASVDADLSASSGGSVVIARYSSYSSPLPWIVPEGGKLTIPLLRTGGSAGPASVRIRQSGGTAVAGTHVVPLDRRIDFAAGELRKDVELVTLDDQVWGTPLSVVVELSEPEGLSVGTRSSWTYSIQENDPTPVFRYGTVPASVPEGNANWTLQIPVVRDGASRVPSTLRYSWSNSFGVGDAEIVFAPGETAKSVGVPVVADAKPGPDRTIEVTMQGATDANIAGGKAKIAVIDDDALEVVATDLTVSELIGEIGVQLSSMRSAPGAAPATLTWKTVDGTAKAGSDYVAKSETIQNWDGRGVLVELLADGVGEPDEVFYVDVTAATNAVITKARATITIQDSPPWLTLSDVTVLEGEPGQRNEARVHATLSRPAEQAASFRPHRMATGSSATAGSDYVDALAQTLVSFLPGEREKQFVIPIIGDDEIEPDEVLNIDATEVVGIVARTSATVTIADDDAVQGATVSVDDAHLVEGTGAAKKVPFTIHLAQPTTVDVRVTYATENATALAGSDYAAASGTAVIRAGALETRVWIDVVADTAVESAETFTLRLLDASPATIADGSAVATIVDDDDATRPAPPVVSVASTPRLTESGGELIIELARSSTTPVTIEYATADLTATAASDYVARRGTVTFLTGSTTAQIRIAVTDDAATEPDETFEVILTSGSAALASDRIVCTIVNDDGSARRRTARH